MPQLRVSLGCYHPLACDGVVWFKLFTPYEEGGECREYFPDSVHMVPTSRDGLLVRRMGACRVGVGADRFCEAVTNLASSDGWHCFAQ